MPYNWSSDTCELPFGWWELNLSSGRIASTLHTEPCLQPNTSFILDIFPSLSFSWKFLIFISNFYLLLCVYVWCVYMFVCVCAHICSFVDDRSKLGVFLSCSLHFYSLYILFSSGGCGCMHTCEWIICGCQFSASTMWALRIECRSSGLVANVFSAAPPPFVVLFWERVSYCTWSLPIWLGWPANKLWNLLVIAPSLLGTQTQVFISHGRHFVDFASKYAFLMLFIVCWFINTLTKHTSFAKYFTRHEKSKDICQIPVRLSLT